MRTASERIDPQLNEALAALPKAAAGVFDLNDIGGTRAANEARNIAFAAEAANFARLSLPALFLNSEWDAVCDMAHGHLVDPMRGDCADLTAVSIPGGHVLMLEQRDAANHAIVNRIKATKLVP